MSRCICVWLLFSLQVVPVLALHPGTEIVVPAAARGQGEGGSLWTTTLYLLNRNAADVEVTVAWLVRNQANPSPQTAVRTVAAGSNLVLDDAVQELFGLEAAEGALLITAPTPVVVNAGIFNRAGGLEYGQGFEGLPKTVAVAAGQTTHTVGIASNSAYRTNFFAVDGSGSSSEVLVEVVDGSGQVVGSRTYQLGAYQPILKSVSDLVAAEVDSGMVCFTVSSGMAFVGSSRINQDSGDPLTLGAWWECGEVGHAPASLAGLELDLVVTPIECGMEPFTENVDVTVIDDRQASITVYGGTMTIPIDGYTAAGNLGYIETSLPDWRITSTWLTMIWSSPSEGRFTGAATDSDGSPIQFSGTFTVTAR